MVGRGGGEERRNRLERGGGGQRGRKNDRRERVVVVVRETSSRLVVIRGVRREVPLTTERHREREGGRETVALTDGSPFRRFHQRQVAKHRPNH